jgi:hypothetical protein
MKKNVSLIALIAAAVAVPSALAFAPLSPAQLARRQTYYLLSKSNGLKQSDSKLSMSSDDDVSFV